MADEIQVGRAVVWGIQNDGTRISITMAANLAGSISDLNIIESAKCTDNFQIDDLKDESNFDVTSIATNQHFEQDLSLIPASTTKQGAVDGCIILDPLTPITISHVKVQMFNGTWQYRGGQVIDLNHQAAKFNVGKIRKYRDTDQNTSLTTVAT